MEKLLKLIGCEFRDGRPESAPKLRTEGGKKLFATMPSPGGLHSQAATKTGCDRIPKSSAIKHFECKGSQLSLTATKSDKD